MPRVPGRRRSQGRDRIGSRPSCDGTSGVEQPVRRLRTIRIGKFGVSADRITAVRASRSPGRQVSERDVIRVVLLVLVPLAVGTVLVGCATQEAATHTSKSVTT